MLWDLCLSVCMPVLSVTLVYCDQTVAWIKMKLGVQVGLGHGHSLLDGYPSSLPQRGTAPQFSAHVYYGQTAGWIKMPLGTEVGLGPGHIVFHRDQLTPKGAQPPIFGRYLLWPNGRPSQLLLSTCYSRHMFLRF